MIWGDRTLKAMLLIMPAKEQGRRKMNKLSTIMSKIR